MLNCKPSFRGLDISLCHTHSSLAIAVSPGQDFNFLHVFRSYLLHLQKLVIAICWSQDFSTGYDWISKLVYCPSLRGDSSLGFHSSKCFLTRLDLFVKDNFHSISSWGSFDYSYQIINLVSLTQRGGNPSQFTKVLLPQEEFNECVWVNVFGTVPLTQEKCSLFVPINVDWLSQ